MKLAASAARRAACRVACRIARGCSALLALACAFASAIGIALFAASFAVRCPEIATSGGTLVFDRRGELLYAGRAPSDALSFPVSIAQVSPWLLRCVVAAEDERFFEHGGIDPLAVLRAAMSNGSSLALVSGASTLEMQVARLCAGIERSWLGKLEQAATALALARRHDKRAILEAWLNRASFGGDTVGCEAAARRWLGKSAAELELHEAALIAGLPQAPERLRPDRHPAAALARRDYVLGRLLELRWIEREALVRARAEPLRLASALASSAPHAVRRALAGGGLPRGGTVVLTLDGALQRLVEARIEAYAASAAQRGAQGLAAVIVENETVAVRAWVGSKAPFARARGLQIDGAGAPRSAGSTLKPFLYARAFELGLVAPQELLEDRPRRVAEYVPQNFDGAFGPAVPAAEALARSLNLPAIEVLDRVGVRDFAALLSKCGICRDAAHVERQGLALALGTCEVRLGDLVGGYAALGRGGLWSPLRFTADAPSEPSRRVLHPRAVAEVRAALEVPAFSPFEELAPELRGYAVKTGTSSGGRDAWCVATSDAWTAGVWIGNPDGARGVELTGRGAAAPLLAEIVALLPTSPAPARSNAERERTSDGVRDRSEALPRRAVGPRLLSPVEGATYRCWERGSGDAPVPLEARPAEAGEALQWWLDGQPLERSAAAFVLRLRAGAHRVRVADREGRASEACFRVDA